MACWPATWSKRPTSSPSAACARSWPLACNRFERARAAGQAGWDTKKGGTDGHRAVVEIRTAPLHEALNVKEAELAQIDLRLASLELRAPADGVVSAINRRPGEVLTAGEAAVVIVAHRPGVFEVFLPQNHAQAPEVGATVTLGRPGILTQRAPGRVIEVAPTITELPVRLRLSPQVPIWGRRIVIDASQSDVMRAVPPGEEVRVRI